MDRAIRLHGGHSRVLSLIPVLVVAILGVLTMNTFGFRRVVLTVPPLSRLAVVSPIGRAIKIIILVLL
jgi:hypothetical protein